MNVRNIRNLYKILCIAFASISCDGRITAGITEWRDFPGSEPRSIKETVLAKILGLQRQHINSKSSDSYRALPTSEDDDEQSSEFSLESAGEISDIFNMLIVTFVVVGILRRFFVEKKGSKNIYMMRNENWRDEEGNRVAIAASLSAGSKLRDTTADKSDCLENKVKTPTEGDLWLLLMSE